MKAQEAFKLAKSAEGYRKKVNEILKQIEEAAMEEKMELFVLIDTVEYNMPIPPLSNEMKFVKDSLEKLGYEISIDTKGESYVPRGLSDDYGEGPKYENYGMYISWDMEAF